MPSFIICMPDLIWWFEDKIETIGYTKQLIIPIIFLVFVMTEFLSKWFCFDVNVGENADLEDENEFFMTLESGSTNSSWLAWWQNISVKPQKKTKYKNAKRQNKK